MAMSNADAKKIAEQMVALRNKGKAKAEPKKVVSSEELTALRQAGFEQLVKGVGSDMGFKAGTQLTMIAGEGKVITVRVARESSPVQDRKYLVLKNSEGQIYPKNLNATITYAPVPAITQ